MDTTLLAVLLTILALAAALNLFLTVRIARIVLPESEEALVPLVGQAAPHLGSIRQTDGPRTGPDGFGDCPIALLFLSPGCPTCKSTIPVLAQILPAAEKAGVALWITGADDVYGVAELTKDTPLAARTVALEAAARKALNPLGAAPLYVFIDAAGTVQAGNYVGDENWRTFIEQMREIEEEEN